MNAVVLFYSAAIVPVQLSFWESEDICYVPPTIYFDVFVDSFFLVTKPRLNQKYFQLNVLGFWFQCDILINFFLGQYINGTYCDDWSKVLQRRQIYCCLRVTF